MAPKRHIETLKRLIEDRLPGTVVGVDAPSRASGDWFVDVKHGEQSFVVEYRPSLGFGLSSVPSSGYGEGPDEFLADARSVADRLVHFVRAREKTEPQRVLLLQDLRSRRQVTQSNVADHLGIRQPTVSKIERREDVNLNTLRRYVEALGGELHVTAKFADETVELGLWHVRDAAVPSATRSSRDANYSPSISTQGSRLRRSNRAEGKKNAGKPDRSPLAASERDEVRYLAKKYALPSALVKNVIKREGPMRKDVETYLRRMKKK